VPEHLMGVHIDHRGPDRNRQHQVFTLDSGTIATGTRLAVEGPEFTLEAIIHQRIQRLLCLQPYGTAITAIAAIRPTPGNILLAPETQAAVTTLTGFNNNGGFINKFHNL